MLTSRKSGLVPGGFEASPPPPEHRALRRPPTIGNYNQLYRHHDGQLRSPSGHLGFPAFLFVVLLLIIHGSAAGVDWAPIDPLNLELDTPRVDPSADAEAIFWENWIDDRRFETLFTTYLRVKIFTKLGAEKQSTVKLSGSNYTQFSDIKARTIKPDGTIVPLEDEAIFEKTDVKIGRLKLKTKSFALPNVMPGDIIEYKWTEMRQYGSHYFRLYLQRDIPVWKVRYHMNPAEPRSSFGSAMGTQCFNIDSKKFERGELFGYHMIEYNNLPAFQPEPYMPPEDQVKAWVLATYYKASQFSRNRFWKDFAKQSYKDDQDEIKLGKVVKQTAAAIVGDARDPGEKLRLIRKYCLTQIRSIDHDRSGITAEERQDLKRNKGPADTLKRRCGNSWDIYYAYAALLKAAGLEVRLARVAGRDDSFFTPDLLVPHFLNRHNVAVRIDGHWQFSDIAAPYLPHGMLHWAEEGVQALIPDSKDPAFVETPLSGPAKSVIRRRARLRLDEDGTLEGSVELELTGHFGAGGKNEADGKSLDERVSALEEGIQNRISMAEVSEINIENVTDLEEPYTYKYRVRVPGYATRTGSRLFLQPAFFQFGREPKFNTSERKYDVYFPFAWTEHDDVRIELPEGFELEDADAPGAINFGPPGHYKVRIATMDDHSLIYTRELVFGAEGYLLFPVEQYPVVKQAFDKCHQQDNHALTLRRTDASRVPKNRR